MSSYGRACHGIEARTDEPNPKVCGSVITAKTPPKKKSSWIGRAPFL